jgi:hypothetical protein
LGTHADELFVYMFKQIVFFTDQCLSGQRIADALTESSGCRTEIFRKHFNLNDRDVKWLPAVGRWRWVLVTKDWRIQERPLERQAIMNAKVRAFILRETNASRDVIIALLRLAMPKMLAALRRYQGPFIFAIEPSGELSPMSILVEITD